MCTAPDGVSYGGLFHLTCGPALLSCATTRHKRNAGPLTCLTPGHGLDFDMNSVRAPRRCMRRAGPAKRSSCESRSFSAVLPHALTFSSANRIQCVARSMAALRASHPFPGLPGEKAAVPSTVLAWDRIRRCRRVGNL